MRDNMTSYRDLLSTSTSVLLVDWPGRDVPDTLARHGFSVISHDGPGATEYNAYRVIEGDVQVRPTDGPPDRVDIVYSHRPIDELAVIVDRALSLNARAIWVQSGVAQNGVKDPRGCWRPPDESARARQMVENAELLYVESPYIADAVREVVEL